MGMFDFVVCEYPFPDNPPPGIAFQTKDTPAQCMETYTITAAGRLIHHTVRYEDVPETERPFYGTPEWDIKPYLRQAGCIRAVPTGDVEVNFTGELGFSGEVNGVWYCYLATFGNGKLITITKTG